MIKIYKITLLFLVATYTNQTQPFIFSLFTDIGKILYTLEEQNTKNRAIISSQLKSNFNKIINKNSSELNNIPTNNNISDNNNNSLENTTNYTFKNLAGEIPIQVKEIVEFIKNPKKFSRLGAQMPRGILLVGPPGTGKTSIARAIAGEANAHFFDTSASKFIELFVGQGPKRVRELFDQAREKSNTTNQKSIIFIDELDAIGGSRSIDDNSEYRNTLNELLHQMDGFNQDSSIIVIGATNTPESIDSALKRPGRFDRIVHIDLPTKKSRLLILEYYTGKIRSDNNINFTELAEKTENFSGADLKNLVNEAAIQAAREETDTVTQDHFDFAYQELTKNSDSDYPGDNRLTNRGWRPTV